MIHSGINTYLTLHVAQAMLRAGDEGWFEPLQAVAALASPTGQWPEAIHPRTGGGCMGDGQHAWAAAEWVMAVRNAFIREEPDRLILGSGVVAAWLAAGQASTFGPSPTRWGPLTIALRPQDAELLLHWQAAWRGPPPAVEIRVPGYQSTTLSAAAAEGEIRLGQFPEPPALPGVCASG
jgi:hypothetical protein